MARRKAINDTGDVTGPESKAESFLGAGSIVLSEDDWLVPASDAKGHSAKLQFRVPPAVSRAIQELVHNPKTAFRTDDDFCRFAVWLTLRMIHSRMDVISPNVLMAADAVVRVVRDHEQMQMIYESIRLAAAMCDRLVADGDVQSVHSRIAYIDSVIANLSRTSRWRKKFEKEWREASQKYRDWVSSQIRNSNGKGGACLEIHDMLPREEEENEEETFHH